MFLSIQDRFCKFVRPSQQTAVGYVDSFHSCILTETIRRALFWCLHTVFINPFAPVTGKLGNLRHMFVGVHIFTNIQRVSVLLCLCSRGPYRLPNRQNSRLPNPVALYQLECCFYYFGRDILLVLLEQPSACLVGSQPQNCQPLNHVPPGSATRPSLLHIEKDVSMFANPCCKLEIIRTSPAADVKVSLNKHVKLDKLRNANRTCSVSTCRCLHICRHF